MATRAIFTPYSAEFPATNFPQLLLVNRRPVLGYDATTNETAQWTSVAAVGWTGAVTALLQIMMASATTGDTDWDVSIEAVTPADATDLDAGDSFDTINSTDNTVVPGTVGYMQEISVTCTNKDNIAAGDYYRCRVTRDAASDTAAGDAYLLTVRLNDGA